MDVAKGNIPPHPRILEGHIQMQNSKTNRYLLDKFQQKKLFCPLEMFCPHLKSYEPMPIIGTI